MQIELSPTQTTILNTACLREDRLIFPVVAKLKGGAVGNMLRSLLAKGLIEEIPATDDMTVWRHSDSETPVTLRATAASCEALGLVCGTAGKCASETEPAPLSTAATNTPATSADIASRPRKARDGTKQQAVIAMLKRPEGASIAEIMEATDWQAHSTRGFIAGAVKKKLGLTVTSEKHETRGRVYKIQE
jgi:Protein of unknown function (DUF3489)